MSEKTEKATPYKLKKAKERGQVSKSMEINTSVLMLLALATAAILLPDAQQQLSQLCHDLIVNAGQYPLSIHSLQYTMNHIYYVLLSLWLPFALTLLITAALVSVSQTGLIWSSQAISPDFKRLNPVTGFKKLWSIKLLFDGFKNTLKLFFAVLLIALVIKQQWATITRFLATPLHAYPTIWAHLTGSLALKLLCLLLALAFLDQRYTQWKYQKDQRMSKHEVKEEHKQQDGDPKIKMKRRQLQQQLRQQNAALATVKSADVVITNPTHIAIALSYDRNSMSSPKVVCKGKDAFAAQIRTVAQQYNIPMIEHVSLARALFAAIKLNQNVSADFYAALAPIFRTIYQQQGQKI